MRTIILNGSPKGNAPNCGSYMIAKAFISQAGEGYEIRSVAKEDRKSLLAAVKEADRIIVVAPNYIHLIPAVTLDFLYALPEADGEKELGFIIQAGYPEASENEITCRLLEKIAARKNYRYLGTIVKGECAGLAILPDKFTKLLEQFAACGKLFAKTGRFSDVYMEEFAKPVRLSGFQTFWMNAMSPIGNALGWNSILKKNHAYVDRKAMPYLKNNS